MKQALIYSLKVWLSSVVVTAIFLVAITPSMRYGDSTGSLLENLILIMAVSLIWSIQCWLILMLSAWLIAKRGLAKVTEKLIITGVGIALTLGLTLLMFGKNLENGLLPISYTVSIVAGIWFYRLRPVNKEV